MTRLGLSTLALVFGVVVLAQNSKTSIGEQHYRVYRGDGRAATLEDVVQAALQATVTFLGESHDDAVAHYLEEQLLRRTYKSDLALSLEMFETDVQPVIDEYLKGLITEDHVMASGRAWKNYKADYKPLIEFAKERKMAVIAANAPRRYVNRVSRLGAGALQELSDAARSMLPPLPYAEASTAYRVKLDRVMEEARKEQEKQKQPPRPQDPVKMAQAQSLWDAGMAFSIATHLTRNPGARVLHCNGSFHTAERLGIVEHLLRYRPETSVVVVTMLSAKSFPKFDREAMLGQGDFVVVTDPALPRSR
jgi:uncharacterized iron-regulated protein